MNWLTSVPGSQKSQKSLQCYAEMGSHVSKWNKITSVTKTLSVIKNCQFSMNFHDNLKNKIRNLISAHCASFMKMEAKLIGPGGVCISSPRSGPIYTIYVLKKFNKRFCSGATLKLLLIITNANNPPIFEYGHSNIIHIFELSNH